jgi:hypothetical protein
MAFVLFFLMIFLFYVAWRCWIYDEPRWFLWFGFWAITNGLFGLHMISSGFEYAWVLMPTVG